MMANSTAAADTQQALVERYFGLPLIAAVSLLHANSVIRLLGMIADL